MVDQRMRNEKGVHTIRDSYYHREKGVGRHRANRSKHDISTINHQLKVHLTPKTFWNISLQKFSDLVKFSIYCALLNSTKIWFKSQLEEPGASRSCDVRSRTKNSTPPSLAVFLWLYLLIEAF